MHSLNPKIEKFPSVCLCSSPFLCSDPESCAWSLDFIIGLIFWFKSYYSSIAITHNNLHTIYQCLPQFWMPKLLNAENTTHRLFVDARFADQWWWNVHLQVAESFPIYLAPVCSYWGFGDFKQCNISHTGLTLLRWLLSIVPPIIKFGVVLGCVEYCTVAIGM